MEPDFDCNAVIQECMQGISSYFEISVEGVSLGMSFDSIEEALAYLNSWMESEKYWPDIYYCNYRGNTDLIDKDGNILESWV